MYFKKQQGVALLEVLIAFVIVTISVAALYQLQNKYLRNEIASSARLTALQIAESKLDDLRTFGSLAVSSGVPAYDNIGNNTGGVIASGAISSSNANVDPFVYNLSWGFTPRAGSTDVTVTVSWNNGNEQIQLSGSVVQATRISSDRLSNSSKVGTYKPVVTYTPVSNSDSGVVSISLGGTYKQETTKPLPDITYSPGNKSGSLLTRFSTISYDTSNNTTSNQVQSDFSTVSCQCDTNNTSVIGKYQPAYPYVTDKNLLYWTVGNQVSKKYGSYSGTSSSPECDICCNHHFDSTPSTNNAFEGYYNQANRAASKYNLDNSGLLTQLTGAGSYKDSCRLLRVNGVYRPMPDWNLVKISVFKSDFLSNATNLAKYQDYIKYVVTQVINAEKNSGLGVDWASSGAVSTFQSSISSISDFKTWSGIDTSISMSPTDQAQLEVRGIFVDIMKFDTSDPNNILNSIDTSKSDFLSKVPFYEVNMTKLSDWSSQSATLVPVTNESVNDMTATDLSGNLYYSSAYSRGNVIPDKKSITATTNTTITATSFQGNSSVAPYIYNSVDKAVSDFENSHKISSTINVQVVYNSNPSVTTIIGNIYCWDTKNNSDVNCTNGQYNKIAISSLMTKYATCKLINSNTQYSCDVTSPITPDMATVGLDVNSIPGTFYVNPSSITLSSAGCFNVYSSTVTLSSISKQCP